MLIIVVPKDKKCELVSPLANTTQVKRLHPSLFLDQREWNDWDLPSISFRFSLALNFPLGVIHSRMTVSALEAAYFYGRRILVRFHLFVYLFTSTLRSPSHLVTQITQSLSRLQNSFCTLAQVLEKLSIWLLQSSSRKQRCHAVRWSPCEPVVMWVCEARRCRLSSVGAALRRNCWRSEWSNNKGQSGRRGPIGAYQTNWRSGDNRA